MKTRATHSIVPPCRFLDDGIFATKNGESGIVMKIYPRDSECMDPAEKDATGRIFEFAMRLIPPGCRVYQYMIKRLLDSVSGERKRADYLESRALYSFDNYIVILRSGLDAAELRKTAESVVVQLGSVMPAEIQGKSGAFSLLRKLMNYDPAVCSMVDWNDGRPYIDYYCSDSSIEIHRGSLLVGDYYSKVMTLKDPPITTEVDMIRGIREIPCECIIVSEWAPRDLDVIRTLIKTKTSHFHFSKKVTHLGYGFVEFFGKILGSRSEQKERLEDQQEDASLDAMEEQLGDLITEIEKNGAQVGEYALTVILFGRDQKSVERSVSEAFKAASAKEMILSGERMNLLFSWISCIPGNQCYQHRAMYLTNRNYADLAMLFAPDTGSVRNEHLNAECLAVLETRQRTPYSLNLHWGDVFHTAFVGQTGAGKSFSARWLLDQAIDRYNARVTIFDIGGSYRSLVERRGGSYMDLGLSNPFTLGPFSMELTPENLVFLHSFVRVLMSVNGYTMEDPRDDRAIELAIRDLYKLSVDQRRLSSLELPEHLAPYLDRWRGDGRYASLFDNADDTLTTNDLQAFDFENLDRYKEVVEAFLYYVFYRTGLSINSDPNRLKIFLVDECWKFIINDSAKGFIRGAFKQYRKKNAGIWIATQSLEDLVRAGMDETVIENCGSLIFLPNPGMYGEKYKAAFNLKNVEVDAIKTMQPRCEWLLRQPLQSKILQLNGA